MKKPTVKQARALRNILIFAGMALCAAGAEIDILMYAGIFVFFCSIIPELLWNKCPHCGKLLGRSRGKTCRYCGTTVIEDDI